MLARIAVVVAVHFRQALVCVAGELQGSIVNGEAVSGRYV